MTETQPDTEVFPIEIAENGIFSIEIAENVRHYRTYTFDLPPVDAQRLRELVKADDSDGLLAFLDEYVEANRYVDVLDPDYAWADQEEPLRDAHVLTVFDDAAGPDAIWEG